MQTLKILYEDNHVISVHKMAGILVQGDKGGEECLMDMVKKFLKNKYNKPGNVFLGLIHRLDRNVSGIVLFAKTSKGASRLSEQFREHTVEKSYTATVHGHIDPAKPHTLMHYVLHDENQNKTEVRDQAFPNSQEAKLVYNIVSHDAVNQTTVVKIILKTGRHHQIRAQFAHIGHPILGDTKYGSSIKYPDQHIDLIASELSFTTATGGEKVTVKL